jgi:hypothetical protein
MLTRQEIFDKAVGGVIAQGALAMDGTACCYRTDDGKKCAIGQLIDDEFYHRSLEGYGAGSSTVMKALLRSGVDALDAMISYLQDAHDNSRDIADFKRRARKIAANYGLSPAVAS